MNTDLSTANDAMTLSFTDNLGSSWTTEAISPFWTKAVSNAAGLATDVATALKALPNFVVDDVSVSVGGTTSINVANTATDLDIYVTFTGTNTAGDQQLLSCGAACPFPGCSFQNDQLRLDKTTTPAGGS